MHSFSPITIFWAEYPALSLAAKSGLKTRHAPSAPRMAHRVHHRAVLMRRDVRPVMRDDVRGKALPEYSLWAAGARPVRIPARAVALLLRKDATGLRALGLKPASLLRTAQASIPVPRSHRAPAGQGQKQNPRGGQRRKLVASARQRHFRRCPPALPRPTEAFDLLQALNTGHSGSLSTIHANSASQALSRLASCVLQSGIELPYKAIKASIADSIHLLIHIERRHARRYINEILAIKSYSPTDDAYQLETVFNRNQQDSAQESKQ